MKQVTFTLSAALLGCVAIWQATDGGRAVTAEGARRVQIAENPEHVPPVSLETMDGSLQMWPAQGQPILLEFIYTTCPTICQTSGGDFAELRDHLTDEGLGVPMYSVSFDPVADALPELQSYGEAHGASGQPWTIARPETDAVAELLDLFRVTVIPDGWGSYQHNIAVLVINPNGEFAGAYDTRAFEDIRSAVEAML